MNDEFQRFTWHSVGEKRSHYGPDWTTPKEVDSSMKSRSDNDGKRVQEALYWESQRQEYVFQFNLND
jgi:hypothetical protein